MAESWNGWGVKTRKNLSENGKGSNILDSIKMHDDDK